MSKSPIISAECYCTSCRTAGAKLAGLAGAPAVLERNGGTHFVLYRKDRLHFTRGAELLREWRLSPQSPTRRVVASCCNTPVFLEFQHGHWLSLYAGLWPDGAAPAPQVRTMTSDLPDPGVLDDRVPNAKKQSGIFIRRLLGAWIAMGLRSPKVAVNGTLQV